MENDFDRTVQKQLDAAMPWVGLYIAAASAVCILAMAADAFNGFRHRKLWFPCKYTSLNAASLTALAVTMKLPMDLNTVMIKSETDAVAKYISLSFMSLAVSNCMPSLGSMNDKEVVANVVGLSILVLTITANIVIQMIELQSFLSPATVFVEILIPTVLMLLSLVEFVSLAFGVSTMKRSLKRMYIDKHKAAIKDESSSSGSGSGSGSGNMDDLDYKRRVMIKYWVMAESSSPQFVIARSVVSTCSSFICSFSYIIITTFHILYGTSADARGQSPYGIYTRWIVIIQSTCEYIAVMVAILRWFVSVVFVSTNAFQRHLKVEGYWIQTLEDWRNGLAGHRWGRCLVDVKWCVLTLCIGLQSLIIILSKTLVFFSTFIVAPFLFCFDKLVVIRPRHHDHDHDHDHDMDDLNLSRYVLLLEGEAELPPRFVKSMCLEANRMIQKGRKMKPSILIDLLHKSVNFNGVGRYNNSQIPSLLSQEPPDCWLLPLVTLTTIAIALPNISHHQRKQLLSGVSEGLSLVKIVEKTLDTSVQLKSIRKVASVTWVQVLLYSKWLGIDLVRRECKNSEEVLQDLSVKAEAMVMELKSEVQDSDMGNKWPLKVVAANSMYRICQTILLSSRSRREESGEELCERLCVMIADILAACFTNLPRAIIKMCQQDSIEKREKSVREAFMLLGKTEQVVGLVLRHQRPSIDDGKEAYIEEWRAFFLHQENDDETSSSSTLRNESGSEVDLAIV